MASSDDGGVTEQDSCKPKCKESSDGYNCSLLENFDLQSLLINIQANVAQNSQVLASLVAERNESSFSEIEGPLPKRTRADPLLGDCCSPASDDGSFIVASLKANNVASMNANNVASTNVNNVASTNANMLASTNAFTSAAQSAFRPSDEDAMSLFGGLEFDTNEDEGVNIDNNALLSLIGEALVPSEVKGPPISEHLAGIVNTKFSADFDLEKRKEILSKYKVPKKLHIIVCTQGQPRNLGKIEPLRKKKQCKYNPRYPS